MNYKKIIIIILVFLALAVIGFLVSASFNSQKNPTTTIKGETFKLLLAKTETDKQVGLSKYQTLPQDTGMIFLFDKPGFYSFWMKDMKFPIDIIYINGDRIVTIFKDQKPTLGNPPILTPKKEADKVLEINAGLAQKYKLNEGDKVEFKNVE